MIDIQPSLASELIRLRPLVSSDFDALYQVASDPLIWEQHQNKDRFTPENFADFFRESLLSKGALCILDTKNNEIIGSSRFKIIDEADEVVEIGWSFLARNYWGGTYNRGAKKLMINYALEHCKNVVFYVNNMNLRSQRALEKLGANKMSPSSTSWVLKEEVGLTYLVTELMP